MKHIGWWALGGAALAFIVYEEFFASTTIPAGYVPFAIRPGPMVLTEGTWSGQGAFTLAAGAKWSQGQRGGTGFPAAQMLALPSGNAPLLLSGLQTGSVIFLAWVDASGSMQSTAITFT